VVRTFRGCQRAPVHLENRASAPTSLTRISFVMGLTVGFPFGGWSKANATTAPRGSLPWRLPGWTPAPPMDGWGNVRERAWRALQFPMTRERAELRGRLTPRLSSRPRGGGQTYGSRRRGGSAR
jgi:hypothetical protein